MIERIYRWLLEESLEKFSDIIDDLKLIRTSSGHLQGSRGCQNPILYFLFFVEFKG